jgi:hypothetical protein
MPSVQRGQLYRRGDKWAVRYYDDQGRRRRKSFGAGREGKQEASDWLSRKLEEVEAFTPRRRSDDPTPEHADAARASR